MFGNGVTVNCSQPPGVAAADTALLLPSPLYTALKLNRVGDATIGVVTDAEDGTLSAGLTFTVDVNVAVPEHVPPEYRLYVTVPVTPCGGAPPVNMAMSWTEAPERTKPPGGV